MILRDAEIVKLAGLLGTTAADIERGGGKFLVEAVRLAKRRARNGDDRKPDAPPVLSFIDGEDDGGVDELGDGMAGVFG